MSYDAVICSVNSNLSSLSIILFYTINYHFIFLFSDFRFYKLSVIRFFIKDEYELIYFTLYYFLASEFKVQD